MSSDSIKERYWRGWIEQFCQTVLQYGQRKVRLQFQCTLITTPAINIPFEKRQKITVYWTEWDRIQRQCQDKLPSELLGHSLSHYKLIKKHVNRILESPIESCIVISSDRELIHQLSVHKTGYHGILRPPRIDQLATNGYVARLIADIKSFTTISSAISGSNGQLVDDPTTPTIEYDLGYFDHTLKHQLVECVVYLINHHKAHITGLTLQSIVSAYLPIE